MVRLVQSARLDRRVKPACKAPPGRLVLVVLLAKLDLRAWLVRPDKLVQAARLVLPVCRGQAECAVRLVRLVLSVQLDLLENVGCKAQQELPAVREVWVSKDRPAHKASAGSAVRASSVWRAC